MTKHTPSNGIIWRDGKAWMWCGASLIEIRFVGLNGKPAKPKKEN